MEGYKEGAKDTENRKGGGGRGERHFLFPSRGENFSSSTFSPAPFFLENRVSRRNRETWFSAEGNGETLFSFIFFSFFCLSFHAHFSTVFIHIFPPLHPTMFHFSIFFLEMRLFIVYR